MKKLLKMVMLGVAVTMSAQAMAAGDINAGKQKAAVCAACHGTDGNSLSDAFPKLAGQNAGYLEKQLANFKSGERQNALMAPMVANLSEQDMADLAAYFASKKMAPGAVSEDLVEAGEKILRVWHVMVQMVMVCQQQSGLNYHHNTAPMWKLNFMLLLKGKEPMTLTA
jgi:cytochrome c553